MVCAQDLVFTQKSTKNAGNECYGRKNMRKRLQDSEVIKTLKLSFRDSKINISNIFKENCNGQKYDQ